MRMTTTFLGGLALLSVLFAPSFAAQTPRSVLFEGA